MNDGPGKYDDACTAARESTQAQGVLLVVLGGNKGNGFSAQFVGADMVGRVPELLRVVADQIEKGSTE
jgi:hypothetical protein